MMTAQALNDRSPPMNLTPQGRNVGDKDLLVEAQVAMITTIFSSACGSVSIFILEFA